MYSYEDTQFKHHNAIVITWNDDGTLSYDYYDYYYSYYDEYEEVKCQYYGYTYDGPCYDYFAYYDPHDYYGSDWTLTVSQTLSYFTEDEYGTYKKAVIYDESEHELTDNEQYYYEKVKVGEWVGEDGEIISEYRPQWTVVRVDPDYVADDDETENGLEKDSEGERGKMPDPV